MFCNMGVGMHSGCSGWVDCVFAGVDELRQRKRQHSEFEAPIYYRFFIEGTFICAVAGEVIVIENTDRNRTFTDTPLTETESIL